MSGFNSEPHNEFHRGNRGRGRYRGRRPYWAGGHGAEGQFHQTQSMPENSARRAEYEFDLGSEDGTGERNENQRGRGKQRPRRPGSHRSRGRGEGVTTSGIQPLFPMESLVQPLFPVESLVQPTDSNDERRQFWAEDYGARGQFHQTAENSARRTEFDLGSEDGTGNRNENHRGQGKQRPWRGKGGRPWKKGRGEGVTTSDIQPLFPVGSFVAPTDDNDENYPGAQGTSTVEQRPRFERRSSSATSKADQRNEGPAPDRSFKVDQNRILDYLIRCHHGSCLVSDLRENHSLFEDTLTPDAVLQALKHCRNVKVLRNGNNLDGSVVKAYFRELRLCFQHRPPKPCKHPKCKHLHLCRDFLMECCYVKHCMCSHDVDSQQNEAVMNNCGVHIFSPDQQLSLIRCTNLMVCPGHNSPERCPNADSCFKLHICNAFVMNKCLLVDNLCSEGHDPFTKRNKTILQLHEMERLPKETVFKMLLAFNRQPQRHTKYAGNCSEAKELKPADIRRRSVVEHEEDDGTLTKAPCEAPVRPAAPVKPPATRNPNVVPFTEFMKLKIGSDCDEMSKDMCNAFEEHSCNLRENCTDRHKSRAAYLWRVKLNGQWISLEKENSAIERAFSYPDIEEYWAMESIPDVQLHLKFEDMSSDSGPIQRLSTPSYVEVRDKVDATRWLWYWHNGSQWIPYGQSDEPPHLDILEAKYQCDPNLICCFEFGSTLYELDFAKMEQKNLRTRYVRKVRRRPLYEEKVEWAPHIRFNNEYHCDVSKLPSGWVPMDTESKDGTELIPLHSKSDAHKRVAAEFFRTMDKSKHQIRRIYKVQNLDLWTHYETKKASVDKHMGRETEVNVFHGTAEEGTARWICGVGFDQRMHGVNGTVYGKGAYFATTAKYSHGYTQSSSRNLRYMFHAKITIGQLAEGNSSLKRPPAIDPKNPMKGLYDSCANNVANPSIYVIFDNNQTYPDYLIEYRDIGSDLSVDQISLSQSQAYAQAFNRFQAANAATTQSTNVFSSYAHQSPPPANPQPASTLSNPPPANPPSNPLFFNSQPANPPPSNPPSYPRAFNPQPSSPQPANPPPQIVPPRPQPTSSQNSSTNSYPPKKDNSCLVM